MGKTLYERLHVPIGKGSADYVREEQRKVFENYRGHEVMGKVFTGHLSFDELADSIMGPYTGIRRVLPKRAPEKHAELIDSLDDILLNISAYKVDTALKEATKWDNLITPTVGMTTATSLLRKLTNSHWLIAAYGVPLGLIQGAYASIRPRARPEPKDQLRFLKRTFDDLYGRP